MMALSGFNVIGQNSWFINSTGNHLLLASIKRNLLAHKIGEAQGGNLKLG